jgi:hypothetical protein
MAIVRWDQLGDLAQLQDRFNHAFSDTYGRARDQVATMKG